METRLIAFCFVAATLAGEAPKQRRAAHRVWIEEALRLLQKTDCDSVCWTDGQSCDLLQRSLSRGPPYPARIYLAKSGKNHGSLAIGQLRPLEQQRLSGVVVFDFRVKHDAQFASNLALFVVEKVPIWRCENGRYIESRNECLRMSSLDEGNSCKNCRLSRLPSVFLSAQLRHGGRKRLQQRLRCRDWADLFLPCPEIQGENGTARVEAHELEKAARENEQPPPLPPFENTDPIRCNLFEICDHAMVVEGAWNVLTSQAESSQRVANLLAFLKANHFPASNVRLFSPTPTAYAANKSFAISAKSRMRSQIRAICNKAYCIDSFLIVIHGPDTANGLLLWDANHDEKVDASEIYLDEELLEDLTECKARRLYLVVDRVQTNGLVAKLNSMIKNVVLGENFLAVVSSSLDSKSLIDAWMVEEKAEHNSTNGACAVDVFRRMDETCELIGATESPATIHNLECRQLPEGQGEPDAETKVTVPYGCETVSTSRWYGDDAARL